METQEHPVTALVRAGETSLTEALKGSPLSLDKFVVGLKSACGGNEKLVECVAENPGSVMQRLVEAAQLGLSPAPVLQHFHLIPRKIKGTLTCTSIVGYRGLISLAMRSGELEDLGAELVHQDEEFSVDRETGKIHHESDPFRDFEPDKLRGAYAWAKIRGRTRLVTMTLSLNEIKKRRDVAQTDNIWQEWGKEMIVKTVLRALLTSGFITLGETLQVMQEMDAKQEEEIRAAEVTNQEEVEAAERVGAEGLDALMGRDVEPETDAPGETNMFTGTAEPPGDPADEPREGPEGYHIENVLVGDDRPATCEMGTVFYNTASMAISIARADNLWEVPAGDEQEALYDIAQKFVVNRLQFAAEHAKVSGQKLRVLGRKIQPDWDGYLDSMALPNLAKLETVIADLESAT